MRSSLQPTHLLSAVLVGTLALGSSACGFIFSHGPPAGHEQMTSFNCTEGNAGPILDVVWGGLNVIGALAAASDPNAYENSGQIVAVGLSWGALSAAAAAVGFDKSKKCREAKRLLAQRQAQGFVTSPSSNDPSAPVAVVVNPPIDSVRVGARTQLVAAAHNSSGVVVPNSAFLWTSSNDAIASVSGAGLVTASAPGTVIIAARTGSVVGTAQVVVIGP